jgi:hypothetical protein
MVSQPQAQRTVVGRHLLCDPRFLPGREQLRPHLHLLERQVVSRPGSSYQVPGAGGVRVLSSPQTLHDHCWPGWACLRGAEPDRPLNRRLPAPASSAWTRSIPRCPPAPRAGQRLTAPNDADAERSDQMRLSPGTRLRHRGPGSPGRLPIGDARDIGQNRDARGASPGPSRRRARRAGGRALPPVRRLVVLAGSAGTVPAGEDRRSGARRAPAARFRLGHHATRNALARGCGDSIPGPGEDRHQYAKPPLFSRSRSSRHAVPRGTDSQATSSGGRFSREQPPRIPASPHRQPRCHRRHQADQNGAVRHRLRFRGQLHRPLRGPPAGRCAQRGHHLRPRPGQQLDRPRRLGWHGRHDGHTRAQRGL